MPTTLARSPLTAAILTALRAVGEDVGDGELPDGAWIGQPNLPGSIFRPFAVLSELIADRSEGPLGDSQADWRLPYMVEYFGVRRDQVSWIADTMRGALDGLRFQVLTLGASDYKVQFVRHDSLGQPQRIGVTNPPFWHQQDGITVWIGKEL
jgi:hypothetical protein